MRPAIPSLWLFLLLRAVPSHSNSDQIDIAITFNVLGTVYPVDATGSECAATTLTREPCLCVGGAARRWSVLSRHALRIDGGNFLSGRGLFADAFDGDVSAQLLANYSAFALGDRSRRTQLNHTLPFIATNYHAQGILPWHITSGPEPIAVLSLLASESSFEFALTRAFDALFAADASQVPTAVILLLDGVPPRDIEELSSSDATEKEAVIALAQKFTRLDLVLYLAGDHLFGTDPLVLNNWAGRPVTIASVASGGEWVTTISSSGSLERVYLNCSIEDHPATFASMNDWKATLDASLQTTIAGYLSGDDLRSAACARAACALGTLVADAAAWFANAQVAVLPSMLFASNLTAGELTEADVLAAVPDTGSELVRSTNVSGAQLRAHLVQLGTTVQLSRELFLSTSRSVLFFQGRVVADDDSFSVAVSSRLESSFSGGDPLSVAPWRAAASYLHEFHGDPSRALNIADIPVGMRSVVHVVLVCGSSPVKREECGRALHAVQRAASDFLVTHVLEDAGCAAGNLSLRDQLIDYMREQHSWQLSAVVASCSHDIEALASDQSRAAFRQVFGYDNYTVIAPSATAPSLASHSQLLRMARTEDDVAEALVTLLSHSTSELALAHDDSLWGWSAAQAFVNAFDGLVLGEGCATPQCARQASAGIAFSRDELDDTELLTLLETLSDTGARYIVLAAYPDSQRALFSAAERLQLLQDIVWLVSLPSVDALGNAGSLLGFREAVRGDLSSLDDYAADSAACQHAIESCDVDGDRLTWAGYSANWVDAIHILAEAAATAALSLDKSSTTFFENVYNASYSNGASVSGDPLDFRRSIRTRRQLDLLQARQRNLSLEIVGSYDAPVFASSLDLLTLFEEQSQPKDKNKNSKHIKLPGSLIVIGIAITAGLTMCACCLAAIRLVSIRAPQISQTKLLSALNVHEVIKSFDHEQHEDRKTSVIVCKAGAHTTSIVSGYGEAFELGGDFVVSSIRDQPASTLLYQAGGGKDEQPTYRLEMWYWEESQDRVEAGDNIMLRPDDEDPRTWWVAYGDLVQDQISEVYQRFKQLPEAMQAQIRRVCETELARGRGPPTAFRGVDKSYYTVVVQPVAAASFGAPIATPTTRLTLESQRFGAADSSAAVRDSDSVIAATAALSTASACCDIFVLNPPAGREINVATMTQRNLATGKTRRIKLEPNARIVRLQFYWSENLRQMSKWNEANRVEGTLWVRYQDPEVQSRLAELYLKARSEPNADSKLALDSFNECAVHADDAKYEVDLKSMWQMRLDTGYRRPVCVMIDTDYSAWGTPSASPIQRKDQAQSEVVRLVHGLPALSNMPQDIQTDPCLDITQGDYVAVLYEHEGGEWAFGREIIMEDDVADAGSTGVKQRRRTATTISTRHARSGWFPLSCVRPADPAQYSVPDRVLADFTFLLPPENWINQNSPGIDAHSTESVLHLTAASHQERRVLATQMQPSALLMDVTRVENSLLWRPFAVARRQINDRIQQSESDRFPLFFQGAHSERDVIKIVTHGFDPAVKFDGDLGRGFYFTSSLDQLQNTCASFVIACRVVLGRSCLGVPDVRAPPHRQDTPSVRFDSTVDRLQGPSRFAIFDSRQVYPAYIIKLRRRDVDAF